MSYETLWSGISSIVTTPLCFAYIFVLNDKWRLSRGKRWALILFSLGGMVALQCGPLWSLNGTPPGKITLGLATFLYCLVLFLLLSPLRRGKLLFTLFTSLALLTLSSCLLALISPYHGPVWIVCKLLINGAFLWTLWTFFRPSFQQVLEIDTAGWYWMSALPLLFAVCIALIIPAESSHEAFLRRTPVMVGLCALIILTYVALLVFFHVINAQYQADRMSALRDTRVNAQALRRQWDRRERGRAKNESQTLEQFLGEVSRAIERGDFSAGQALVQSLDAQLLPRPETDHHYATEPLLDTVLEYYAQWAQEEGVDISIRFQLPAGNDVDHPGLAVVLCNAMENAMEACRALPPEGREIQLIGRSAGEQFFLSIYNTCQGPVPLDPETGLPTSRRPGHGYGTKSMAAFAAKHDGTLLCISDDTSFRLELLF